jgi:hypothetical protein
MKGAIKSRIFTAQYYVNKSREGEEAQAFNGDFAFESQIKMI